MDYLLSLAYYFEGQYSKQRVTAKRTYARKGASDQILGWCEQLERAHPSNALAVLLLADACGGNRKYDRALECNARALKLNPALFHAELNAATIYLELDQVDKAMDLLEKVAAKHPQQPVAYCNLATIWRTKRNSCDQAIKILEKAIELNATSALVYDALGSAYEEKGNPSEALKCYRKALELDPEYSSALERSGYILSTEGQWEAAIKTLQRAIEIDPRNVEAYCILGIAFLEGKREKEQAVALFQKALELDPDGPSGRKAKLCLERVQPRSPGTAPDRGGTPSKAADEASGYEKIEGAFGQKFGAVFEPAQAVSTKSFNALAVNGADVAYEFVPTDVVPGFSNYYVHITPKTHRICIIFAVKWGPPDHEACARLAAMFEKKYDRRSGFSFWNKADPGRNAAIVTSNDVTEIIYSDASIRD